ncbi:carbohydrate sulfotransferase 9-like isoform X1 [Pelobates cultripes]|uniref:Carbohydrate sulfotransferase n=1 Tax=Pelobates cultripes TaxID=61616 RepID=A0AAD1WZ11_PELCU|nr:carbohydrate sulfotransferase 9-like isoform X1 [Pelobates cultripes]
MFLYCEVLKAGCSNWKRIIFVLKTNVNVKADYLEHDHIHGSRWLKRLSDYPKEKQCLRLANYTKVIFTRDPLQRIVSAYRDKFFHAAGYHGIQLPKIIKAKFRKNKTCLENVSFDEFVHYILENKPKTNDVHWRPFYHLCDPCNINYDILGKFETLKPDSDYVLKVIGAPPGLKYPEVKQFNESRTDAKTSAGYYNQLPLDLLQSLLEIYSLDFYLFDYAQ